MFMTIEPFCPKSSFKNLSLDAEAESEIIENQVNQDFDEAKSLKYSNEASPTDSPKIQSENNEDTFEIRP